MLQGRRNTKVVQGITESGLRIDYGITEATRISKGKYVFARGK